MGRSRRRVRVTATGSAANRTGLRPRFVGPCPTARNVAPRTSPIRRRTKLHELVTAMQAPLPTGDGEHLLHAPVSPPLVAPAMRRVEVVEVVGTSPGVGDQMVGLERGGVVCGQGVVYPVVPAERPADPAPSRLRHEPSAVGAPQAPALVPACHGDAHSPLSRGGHEQCADEARGTAARVRPGVSRQTWLSLVSVLRSTYRRQGTGSAGRPSRGAGVGGLW